MFPRWWRLGIRLQLTIIVVLAAALSTAATLFIADNAIHNYVLQQARTQEQDNMKIAVLVLQTQYGRNISIASDNTMVADLPGTGKDFNLGASSNFGKYPLDNNTDYVDYVQQLIDNSVSIYKCADAQGNFTQCTRIATTFTTGSGPSAAREIGRAITADQTPSDNLYKLMNIGASGQPRDWQGIVTIDGKQYFADYSPLLNPQQQLIGVLYVGVPLSAITAVETRTALELILIGTIIMVAGVVLALFFASAIIGTLQRAARQVSGASERIGSIAVQQSSGSAQQVWAINAINQALQNFSETAQDISHRTDQLALMGNQVLQRRSEISPTQIDSILAYITRSVRDISVASRQQASQYERMTGAMQAVIEIAEQVAGSSQQASESSERLELVVRQLQQLVGVRSLGQARSSDTLGSQSSQTASNLNGASAASTQAQPRGQGTVRAVRPGRQQDGGVQRGGASGRLNSVGARNGMPPMAGMPATMRQQLGMPPVPGAVPAQGGGQWSANGAGMSMTSGGPIAQPVNGGAMRMPARAAMPPAAGMFQPSGPLGQPPNGQPAAGPDWRLPPMPPMPEMPPLPDWDGPPMAQSPQGQRGSDDSRFGVPKAGAQPFGSRGRGTPGMSGPYSGPGMSGPNGGWPEN